jgi:hypothetical protein
VKEGGGCPVERRRTGQPVGGGEEERISLLLALERML